MELTLLFIVIKSTYITEILPETNLAVATFFADLE
jgi:hypothetical protein